MSAEGHTRAEEFTHDSPSVATTQDADDEGSGSKAEDDNDDDDEDDNNANAKGKKVEKARTKKGRLIIRLSRATTQEQSHQIKDTRGNIISETRSKLLLQLQCPRCWEIFLDEGTMKLVPSLEIVVWITVQSSLRITLK
ncbi:unnamed protein product [Cuscuta epithymum]|uniref:Uncharacterized protein n=1 Tax=Cuscuta epithymum TaxID=186058 RepID=A0AAV0FS03_9ASTE|nr:unnamed protein product [Cuscuta epithymum]